MKGHIEGGGIWKGSEGWINKIGSTEGSLDRKADLSPGMEEDSGKPVPAFTCNCLAGGVKVPGV